MSARSEYEQVKARVDAKRAANGYTVIKLSCCGTCKNKERGYEGEMYCSLLREPRWRFNAVEALGWCCRYKPETHDTEGKGA